MSWVSAQYQTDYTTDYLPQCTNPEAIIANSAPLMTGGLKLDLDHSTDRTPGASPAAGWITELVACGGGVIGRVKWTELGRQTLAAGTHKYISPVFYYDVKDNEVKQILRAAMTDRPNLWATAICSRQNFPAARIRKTTPSRSRAATFIECR